MFTAVFIAWAAVVSAATVLPPKLPQDPAVSTGVLPNGVRYYIVSNPSEKGMAEFAMVRKGGTDEKDSLYAGAVLQARASVTDIPRFPSVTARGYAARYGASSSMCRRQVPVSVRVADDAVIYRFGTFPVAGRESVIDSTVLVMFSIMERLDRSGPPAESAVIVSGDVGKDAVLSKMKMLSLVVPAVKSFPQQEDSAYVWKDTDTVRVRVRTDTSAAVTRISMTYSSPRVPREYIGTAVPAVSSHMTGILDNVIRKRLFAEMERYYIPVSDIRCRYVASKDWGRDEEYTVSVTTDNRFAEDALEVLFSVIADLDLNGAREREYAGARNEYLVQQYRNTFNPVICNSEYVDDCISSFLYGSAIVSAKERFRFLVRGRLADSTRTRLFNNFVTELLDSTRNMTVSVTTASTAVTDGRIREILSGAWKNAAFGDTLTSYSVNLSDSLALADAPPEKLKVERTVREPVSGGTLWTFSNGIKVVYKRMDTGGLFYYDLMIRGGFSAVKDLRRGEGAFYSDILETYDIAGLRSEDFNDLMLSGGITMSSEVSVSDMNIFGMAPRPSLTLLLKCLRSVANERTVNKDVFAYYAMCERLRLKSREGSISDRKAAIDSLMCPSYHYSRDKSAENLHPDSAEKAMQLFDSHFSRANDGVLIIVGDMEETAMRRFLQKNLAGFRTEPMSAARIRLPYQPISGWTTHIVEGRRQSLDVAMSAQLQFSAGNYMAMKVASLVLESELNRKFCGSGAYARVFCEFSGYPQERVNFLVSVFNMDTSLLPLDERFKDPLVLLYDVRAVLSALSDQGVPDDRVRVCRDIVKNEILSLQTAPWYWVDVVTSRFTDGKDLNSGYAGKVDSVTPEKVRELISVLSSGSRVEYVVR